VSYDFTIPVVERIRAENEETISYLSVSAALEGIHKTLLLAR
jgi:hypothetical protein